MGGVKTTLLGTDGAVTRGAGDRDAFAPLGGADRPGPIATPLGTSRIIATVTKDWDPTPNPRKTPEIKVEGATLAKVFDELNKQGEWGQAGGILRTDDVPAGNTTNLTVNLKGGLIYRLPTWTKYSSASTAAKAEWDRMFAKLKAHEDRHLEIAIEEGDQLASDLVGHDIDDIPKMVTAANKRMKKRQDDLDAATDHGAKENVKYGDVFLDTSIT
jgi:hypothetical protein